MLYKVHESDNFLFIVMELLQGGSLKALLNHCKQKNYKLNEEQIAVIMKQIFEGLHYTHSKNFMHSDLKLENIVFKNKNKIDTLKLIDFGLGIKFDNSLTQFTYGKFGTYAYMAPEQMMSMPNSRALVI